MNVRVAFDASSLLPLVLPGHPRYDWMKPWDEAVRAGRIAGVVLAHARAELFTTATAIPESASEVYCIRGVRPHHHRPCQNGWSVERVPRTRATA